MPLIVTAFASGLVFGIGLLVSGMMQPAKVLAFLDLFGNWDPTLAVVMAAALVIAAIGFALTKRREAPLFARTSMWPTRRDIDRPLIVGAVLFGVGWGLVGLCPGPALENLVTFSPQVIVFVTAMAVGMLAQSLAGEQRLPRREPALASDG